MKALVIVLTILPLLFKVKGFATDNITTIYLVSSCHLDVGFANTAQNIVNEYFDKYFPDAIKIANELRDLGGEERLVFTTHPYLVYLYTHCSVAAKLGLHCPTPTQLAQFTDTVKRGDITWHAFPFNSQMEFYDSTMADFGFNLTHTLDAMFGRKPTITMSQRDVPGTTRSIIPIMNRNGVKALTVGVNYATMPPAVPSVFKWKDTISGDDIIAMWHPHGYGGEFGPSKHQMVTVPGLNEALAFAVRGDNSGPPSALEVIKNYVVLKTEFPNAKIVASGYDVFVEKLLTVYDQLPTITKEIGDVWIYGVSSDPYKTAATRAIMRQFSECLESSQCSLKDPEIFTFAALALKNGEHTWGEDVKKFLHDFANWTNSEFKQNIDHPNYQNMVKSWIEQREWGIDFPLGQLSTSSPLKQKITDELKAIPFDGQIDTSSYKQVSITGTKTCGSFTISFSAETGGINNLQYLDLEPFATEENQLAQIIYQTFTQDNFQEFLDEYVYDFLSFYYYLDFGKLGLNGTKKFTVSPTPISLWLKETESSCIFLLESKFSPELITNYGASQEIWTEIEIPKGSKRPTVDLFYTIYIVNKTATRIPESLSLYFNPAGVDPKSMTVSKLGMNISPLNVIKNGSQHLHACDENGVSYNDAANYKLHFRSSDVALVCIGYPTPFPVPMETPDVSKGFSFNIVNNIWGTNYIMWYPFTKNDVSSKYRFKMTCEL